MIWLAVSNWFPRYNFYKHAFVSEVPWLMCSLSCSIVHISLSQAVPVVSGVEEFPFTISSRVVWTLKPHVLHLGREIWEWKPRQTPQGSLGGVLQCQRVCLVNEIWTWSPWCITNLFFELNANCCMALFQRIGQFRVLPWININALPTSQRKYYFVGR